MPDINVPLRFVQTERLYINIETKVTQATRLSLSLSTPVAKPFALIYLESEYGNHKITGTVKALNLISNRPLRRKVHLIDELSGRFVREVWSDPTTGEYTFNNILGDKKYSVVAYDYLGFYAAVIADNLTPTEMT